VLGTTPVDHADRLEDHVLEALQTEAAGGGPVETSAAKPPVATLHRPVVHDIVGGSGLMGVIVFFLQIDTLTQKNSSRDNHLQNWLSRTACAFGAD
jgi:hypothetical protein